MFAKVSPEMNQQQEDHREHQDTAEQPLLNIFLNFARESSSHGFPRIFTSKSYFWKIHWTLIFLTFTGLCCWQIVLSLNTYFEYGVNVIVTIEYERELDFPSVTVCNMNALRVNELKGTRYEDLFNMKAYFSDNNCQAAPNMPCDQQNQGSSNQAGSTTGPPTAGQQGAPPQEQSTPSAIQTQQGIPIVSVGQTQQIQVQSVTPAVQNQQTQPVPPVNSTAQSQQTQQVQSVVPTVQTQPTPPVQPVNSTAQSQQTQQVQSATTTVQTQQTQPAQSGTTTAQTQQTQQAQSVTTTVETQQTQPVQPVNSTAQSQQTQQVQSVVPTVQTQPTPPVQPVNSTAQSQQTQQVQSVVPTVQTQPTPPVQPVNSTAQSQQTQQQLALSSNVSGITLPTVTTTTQSTTTTTNNNGNQNQGKTTTPPRRGDGIRLKLSGGTDFWGLMKASEVTDLSDISSFFTPTKKEIRSHGHRADDLIRQCSFNQASCTTSDFIMTENRRYGMCYTFNHGQGESIRTTSKYGSQSGLKLTLHPEEKEYAGLFYQEVGIKVLVHAAHTTPYPEDMGIVVTPGMATNVAIRMKQVDKLGDPFGDCRLDNGTEKYSLLNCTKECLYDAIKTQCECEENLVEEDWNKTCSFMNATQYVCVQTVTDLYTNNSLDCSHCLEPCSETRYLTQVSISKWPAPPFLAILNSKEAQNSTNASAWIVNGTNPETDYARLFIYFDDLEYDKVKQEQAYTIPTLLGDIGGTLGLYVGISFCTLYELVEVAINLLAALWTRHMTSKRQPMISVEPLKHYT